MEDGLFQCVAGKAAIAGGAGIGFLPAGIVAQQGFGAGFGQGVALVFGKDPGDLQQLHGGVVRELDPVGKTAGKAAVGGEEGLHLPGVTCQNDHQLIPVILHPLHQRVDGFQPEAVLLTAVEAVCLVNEEHTTQRALDDAVGQGGGVAGVAAHKVAAAHLNELPALEGPDGLEIPGHQPGNGGLARAGIAREDHVHGEAGGLKAARRCCT